MRFLLCPVLRALPVRWISGLLMRLMEWRMRLPVCLLWRSSSITLSQCRPLTYAIKACLRRWDRRNDLVWCVRQSGMRNHKWFWKVTRERLKNSADTNYRSPRRHAAGKDWESLRETWKTQAFKYCEKNRWRKQSSLSDSHKTCQVTWKSDKKNIIFVIYFLAWIIFCMKKINIIGALWCFC